MHKKSNRTGSANRTPRPVNASSQWKHLFPPRQTEFIPQFHLAGRFGGEGVPARSSARLTILNGLKLEWTSDTILEPMQTHLEALLDGILSVRLEWRRDENIESRMSQLRKEVVHSAPVFILQELLRNAFDAHARANRKGPISLCAYATNNDWLVLDVSDNGIGIQSVHQGPESLCVCHKEVLRNWHPVIEGELGVGLIWSKFLVELHGGALEFLKDVYPGKKTTVRASFPPGVLRIWECQSSACHDL